MGLSHELAHGSLRFSLGRESTEADISRVLVVLPRIIAKLRAMSPM
jgi:cysteine desulfurase